MSIRDYVALKRMDRAIALLQTSSLSIAEVSEACGFSNASYFHRICKEHTGLDASFTTLGSGFFRVFEGEELESFTNFTLLVCEDAAGDLQSDDELAEYFWADSIDQERPSLLPNMPTLIELYETGKPFFVEKHLPV